MFYCVFYLLLSKLCVFTSFTFFLSVCLSQPQFYTVASFCYCYFLLNLLLCLSNYNLLPLYFVFPFFHFLATAFLSLSRENFFHQELIQKYRDDFDSVLAREKLRIWATVLRSACARIKLWTRVRFPKNLDEVLRMGHLRPPFRLFSLLCHKQ